MTRRAKRALFSSKAVRSGWSVPCETLDTGETFILKAMRGVVYFQKLGASTPLGCLSEALVVIGINLGATPGKWW
jgi:hypothetical protein